MSIEVEFEVVITLADVQAVLDAARPFVGSITNDVTRALGEALKPLEAAVNPLLAAIEPPMEMTE